MTPRIAEGSTGGRVRAMTFGKLAFRTTDGALHRNRVGAVDDQEWTFTVDGDVTLTRLPLGTILFDLDLVLPEASAPRHRREATLIRRSPVADDGVVVELG